MPRILSKHDENVGGCDVLKRVAVEDRGDADEDVDADADAVAVAVADIVGS
jgi:hypothetical protein